MAVLVNINNRYKYKYNSGFSLLQTLIIMFCFSIILAGVLSLFASSSRVASNYKLKSESLIKQMFLLDFWHLVMKNRVYIPDDFLPKLDVLENNINASLKFSALYMIYPHNSARVVFKNLNIKSDLLLKTDLYPDKSIILQDPSSYSDLFDNNIIDFNKNIEDKFYGLVFIYFKKSYVFKSILQCDFKLITPGVYIYRASCINLDKNKFYIKNNLKNKIKDINLIVIWPFVQTAYFLSDYNKQLGLYQLRVGESDYKQLLLPGVSKLNFKKLYKDGNKSKNKSKNILQISYDFLGESRVLEF
jgi:hypothetical protein